MNERLHDDIVSAQKIVASPRETSDMYNAFSMVYRGTNEAISSEEYKNLLRDRDKILTITASGDQLINSILFGSRDITCVDISRFAKYYAKLKLSAIKSLDKEEYLRFFTGKLNEDLLSYDLYEKVRVNLDDETAQFWDSLYDYFDEVEINESCLFSREVMNRGIMVRNNPFLKDDNYEKTRELIDGSKITFRDGNVYQMFHNSPGYSLINLSNIIEHTRNITGYRDFLERLPLNEDGAAMSYFFSYRELYGDNEKVREIFSSEDYKVKEIVKDTYSNGILIYKRVKR